MTTRSIPLTNFDRLAASFFSRPLPRLTRQIPVDAVQRGERLVLTFDLPGVPEDAVELNVDHRTLTVSAERPASIAEGDTVFMAERPWGVMSRQIVVGESLDLDQASATFANGVLEVVVPIAASSRSRRIEIQHAPVSTEAIEATSQPD
ncbi:MAG TPA: Hsp20/alpha crystallin family protein [Acidimicrobiales bacterium]